VKPIFESCCGLDVHRDQVTACIASGLPNEPEEKFIVKEFSSMTYGLRELSSWLKEHNVEFVAMESTGIFWKPVFNILEDDFEVILANAAHIKNVPGLKTDKKDARWIAKLLRYGLVPASFIPPRNIRNLRDLTRTRKKLIEELTRRKNRIHKVLQDANIKLSSVATNIFGVSGDKAMDSTITDHHRFLLKMHFEQMGSISNQIAKFDEVIDRELEPCKEGYELIQTCPGLNKITSASILAEIGFDISQFPDKHHICSWAAICPGNNESAGKRKSGRTRHGNNYLKTILVEAAWAASRTKDTYLSAKFHNIAKRRGNKRAAVATGHKILEIVYHILSKREPYKEIGPEAARSQNSRANEYSMIQKLEKAGYNVQKVEVPT
jgi:transposase